MPLGNTPHTAIPETEGAAPVSAEQVELVKQGAGLVGGGEDGQRWGGGAVAAAAR